MTPDQLNSIAPGALVTALYSTWRYAGRLGDSGVLVANLQADLTDGYRDLSDGYVGRPEVPRHLVTVATGRVYQASIVPAHHIEVAA